MTKVTIGREQVATLPLARELLKLLELSLNGDEQQQAKARNKLRTLLAALSPASQGVRAVPVGWQFFYDGKWWNGDDRIEGHRENTEAAGYPVRDVYAAPAQPAERQEQGEVQRLREALEKTIASLDQLLPYLGKVPADIGLLNDALISGRAALAAQEVEK